MVEGWDRHGFRSSIYPYRILSFTEQKKKKRFKWFSFRCYSSGFSNRRNKRKCSVCKGSLTPHSLAKTKFISSKCNPELFLTLAAVARAAVLLARAGVTLINELTEHDAPLLEQLTPGLAAAAAPKRFLPASGTVMTAVHTTALMGNMCGRVKRSCHCCFNQRLQEILERKSWRIFSGLEKF